MPRGDRQEVKVLTGTTPRVGNTQLLAPPSSATTLAGPLSFACAVPTCRCPMRRRFRSGATCIRAWRRTRGESVPVVMPPPMMVMAAAPMPTMRIIAASVMAAVVAVPVMAAAQADKAEPCDGDDQQFPHDLLP